MINTLYLPELREMLAENNEAELAEFCTALHPARTAEFMEGLTAEEAWRVLRHAELPARSEIFAFLDRAVQVAIVQNEDRGEIAAIVAEMPPDDRVDLLNEVDDAVVAELLPLLPADERRDIIRLSAYPEGTAGAVMTTEVAKLSENLTVREALDELAREGEEFETIYYLYIVDDTEQLRGLVSARELLSSISKPNTRLGEIMETDLVAVNAFDDQEHVADVVARYDFFAIPVIDRERRLVGIITHDDVIDVVREEATEDAHRIAAVNPLENTYMNTSVMVLSRKRGMWLTILFFAAMLTALALREYEDKLSALPWLVMFIPLVISSGGNSGSQSSTLVITALTTGDVTVRDWLRVVRREIAMGLILGGFLGVIGALVAWLLAEEVNTLATAMILPITLILVVVVGTFSGSLLPLVFKRLGLDPAMMSTPFVTGIIDILGIVIYMNVALWLIGIAGG